MNTQFFLRRSLVRCGALFGVLALLAAPASAQWSAYGWGGASIDTKETVFLHAGMSATPGGPGWAPTVGLSAHRLTFESGTSDVTLYSVRPSVGMRYAFQGGTAGFSVGYAFVSKDAVVPAGVVVEDATDGVVLAGSLNFTDQDRRWASQTLASTNLRSSSIWARQRFTTRVGPSGRLRVGPEVSFNKGSGYQSYQVGGVASWLFANGFQVGGGIGRTIAADADDATYFKVDFGTPLFR